MSFFITLPSFPRPSFESNTGSSFKVRLPNRLALEGYGWKVGLASITLPNMCFLTHLKESGIQDNTKLITVDYKTTKSGQADKIKKTLTTLGDLKRHKHSFHSGVDFFSLIVGILEERRYQYVDPGYKVDDKEFLPFTIKPLGDDYELHVGKKENANATNLKFKMNSKLAKLMRFVMYNKDGTPTRWLDHHVVPDLDNHLRPEGTGIQYNALFKYIAAEDVFEFSPKAQWRFINLNRCFDNATKRHKRTLLVYSNVGKSTIVGDQVVSLLREVDYNPRQGQMDHFHFEPQLIQYHDVQSSEMEILEVQITEVDNTLVDLAGTGVTTLVLHFKKE